MSIIKHTGGGFALVGYVIGDGGRFVSWSTSSEASGDVTLKCFKGRESACYSPSRRSLYVNAVALDPRKCDTHFPLNCWLSFRPSCSRFSCLLPRHWLGTEKRMNNLYTRLLERLDLPICKCKKVK
jgi:hypothetical protein